MASKIPNFFIVGAAKSGTTSVYKYLSQHPEIYLSPNKEPHYFSMPANKFPHKGKGDSSFEFRSVKNLDDYNSLFECAKNEKAIGEASTSYLYYHKTTVSLIYNYNSDAKILIMLRNPVERAFSAYRHMRREKRETLSFEKAIKVEQSRMRDNYAYSWFYTDFGFYHDRVQLYLNTFKQNLKICLFEDFDKNPTEVLKEIFKFLEVDVDFIPNIETKHNTSKLTKFGFLNGFFNEYDHPLKNVLRPVFLNTIGRDNTDRVFHYVRDKISLRMKSETRKYLTDLYREDVLKLQDLIEKDLSSWM